MPRGTLFNETTAADLAGFVDILWTVAQRALRASQRPEYDVYREETNRANVYWAEVHVYQDGVNDEATFHFAGRPVPDPDLSMQVAAWEAISRLHEMIPTMNCRAFRFYPRRALGENPSFASTQEEQDVAVVHLTRYLVAMTEVFIQLMDILTLTQQATPLVQPRSRARASTATSAHPSVSGDSTIAGIPVAVDGNPFPALSPEYLRLFSAYAASTRAAHRSRNPLAPRSTPAPSENGDIRGETPATPLPSPDVNQVD